MTTGITQGFRVIPEVTPKLVNNTNVHSKFTLISIFSKIHSLKSEHIHSFFVREYTHTPSQPQCSSIPFMQSFIHMIYSINARKKCVQMKSDRVWTIKANSLWITETSFVHTNRTPHFTKLDIYLFHNTERANISNKITEQGQAKQKTIHVCVFNQKLANCKMYKDTRGSLNETRIAEKQKCVFIKSFEINLRSRQFSQHEGSEWKKRRDTEKHFFSFFPLFFP